MNSRAQIPQFFMQLTGQNNGGIASPAFLYIGQKMQLTGSETW